MLLAGIDQASARAEKEDRQRTDEQKHEKEQEQRGWGGAGGHEGVRRKRGGGKKAMRVGSAKGCRVTNEIVVPFCLQYCRGCICGARVDKGRGGEGERTRRKIGPWAPYPDTSSASSETPCDLSTRRVMRTRPTKNYLFLSSSSPRRYPRPGGGGRGGSPRLD